MKILAVVEKSKTALINNNILILVDCKQDRVVFTNSFD